MPVQAGMLARPHCYLVNFVAPPSHSHAGCAISLDLRSGRIARCGLVRWCARVLSSIEGLLAHYMRLLSQWDGAGESHAKLSHHEPSNRFAICLAVG